MRIRLIWEGKTKNAELHALETDYRSRIGHFTRLEVDEVAPDRRETKRASRPRRSGDRLSPAERRLLERVSGSYKVCLDPGGREWTSEQFAEWLGRRAVGGERQLAFLVGGPEGFSAAFKRQAELVLALSRMTLTHDWTRVLLLEQIYRGFTILRGYPYPR